MLAKVGGFEIGGIAGLILGAAAQQKAGADRRLHLHRRGADRPAPGPVLPGLPDRRPPQRRAGPQIMHEHLGLTPLLDLNLRLGEGTGAALAMNVVAAARAVLTEVATFDEAAVAAADK